MRSMINWWKFSMKGRLYTVKWTKRKSWDRVRRDQAVIRDTVCRPKIIKRRNRRTQVLVQWLEDTKISKLSLKLISTHTTEISICRHTSNRFLWRAPNFSSMWSTTEVKAAFKTVETPSTNQALVQDWTQRTTRDRDRTLRIVLEITRVLKSQ